MTRLISFVIPCYRSELTISGVCDEIKELMSKHPNDDYEIVLVNDSSPDNVWNVISELSTKDSRIIGVNLAKNFGQHAAIMAGFKYVHGDLIVCLDDDGQIAVEDTYKLVDHLDNGYDVVYGKYKAKKHNVFRNIGTWFSGWMAIHLLGVPKTFAGSSFFVARRYVVDEITKYDNSYVYLIGLVFRTTNKVDSVFVGHRARQIGDSGYTFARLLSLWINGATTFSVKPLRVSSMLGFFTAIAGVISTIAVVINKLIHPEVAVGWSSLMSIVLVLSGVILVMLGAVGEYVGRLYMSANKTPQFVVRDVVGNRDSTQDKDRK